MRLHLGGLVVVNESTLPTRSVEAVVRRAARDLEVDESSVCVKVKHTRAIDAAFGGTFYADAAGTTLWSDARHEWVPINTHDRRHLVILRVHVAGDYPLPAVQYQRRDMPAPYDCETWQEALAAIAGHELQHLRAYEKPGRHGRSDETSTNWAAFRAWRRERDRGAKRRIPRSGEAAAARPADT